MTWIDISWQLVLFRSFLFLNFVYIQELEMCINGYLTNTIVYNSK